MKKEINIVWLKRDLRLQDHEPLFLAEKSGLPYIIIYIFEPSLINHLDTSNRHLQFIYHSILDLNKKLNYFNKSVEIFFGHSLDIFKYLIKTKYWLNNDPEISHFYSYLKEKYNIKHIGEESENMISAHPTDKAHTEWGEYLTKYLKDNYELN